MADAKTTESRYRLAQEQYAQNGVNTEQALDRLAAVSISMHCWQGDDVSGFETPDAQLSGGGLQVFGSFPGRARTPDELRQDLARAFSLIPGKHRLNLHAMYGEFGGKKVDRNQILPEHFSGWVEWCKNQGLGLDFNATCFSHPKAESGFTLSHADAAIRDFWTEHVVRARRIASYIGAAQGNPCLHNLWIPDGSKDLPADRKSPRERLIQSLDRVYKESLAQGTVKDSVESKLFGLGSESYVVGSHDFYLGYALSKGLIPCLDMGHFHPTESIADKISAILPFSGELLVHASRGIRWDSDHVVVLNDELRDLFREIVRGDCLNRIYLASDFFDASINRVGAWVTGVRAIQRALLMALLEPRHQLAEMEREGDLLGRLALMDHSQDLPWGVVWDRFCEKQEVPPGVEWLRDIRDYEKSVLARR